jgi:hypothetical protein
MGILMLPAGLLNIVLGITTDDVMIKVLTILAGIVTLALSCLIASYLRHLENHGKVIQEISASIDHKIENQVSYCTKKMDLMLKAMGLEDEE